MRPRGKSYLRSTRCRGKGAPARHSPALRVGPGAGSVWGVNLSRRISFYEQLATMTSAGIPLRQALERAGQRWADPQIAAVIRTLNQGQGAAEAFLAGKFTSFETKLVAAGERSGRLDDSFKQLATYWKTENELVGAMWKHLAYPILLLHLVAIIGPLPRLATCSVPFYVFSVVTQLAFLYGVAFVIYWGARESWRSEAGQAFWLRVPLVGRFLRATYAYRWVVALRMELNSGISFAQAAADAWEATGYSSREKRAAEAREGLLSGEPLSTLVAGWRELPVDWVDYFTTAEVSGKIYETLGHVEANALTEWKRAQERLADWLPKLLYLVLILYAAFQIFSMALGVFGKVNEVLDSVGQ